MKSEIFDFMAMKSAFMGFSRYFHGIFMKKIFIVDTRGELSFPRFYIILTDTCSSMVNQIDKPHPNNPL